MSTIEPSNPRDEKQPEPEPEPERKAEGGGGGPPPRSRKSTAAALVVLTAVIAGAGWMIYQNAPEELLHPSKLIALFSPTADEPAPNAAAAPAVPVDPNAPDPADVKSKLVVIQGDDGRPVVALARPWGPGTLEAIQGTIQQLIYRELIRQSILMTARDELGLATRDELLDDAIPNEDEGESFELSTLFRRERSRAVVRRGEGDDAEVLLLADLGEEPDAAGYEAAIVARVEELSRTDFVELLNQLGLKGEPNKVVDTGPLPDGVEEKLQSLGLVENFAAIRALHEAIRTDGESPERLGALARGYAQLGALSGHHWSAAHRAFDARALLYAERLMARRPKSVQALRDRAFVRATIGYDYLAIADLDEAKKLDEASKDAADPTDWVDVIDARLRFDVKRLAEHKGPNAKLAAYLKMVALEFPRDTRAVVNAARTVLETAPDCDRAYDVICENGNLGDKHQMTVLAPTVFETLFPAKLKALDNAPAGVREVLDNPPDDLALIQALDEAGTPATDSGELSWGVLAHLAREARFSHIWRRLYFMTASWAVPADDYWDEVQDLVDKRHRYRPYLELMGNPAGGAQQFVWFADRLDLTDIEAHQHRMMEPLLRMGHPTSQFLWGVALGHGAPTAGGFAAILTGETVNKEKHGRALHYVSPHSPFGMATLAEFAWDSVKDEVPEWEKEAGDSPALLGALARKFIELKQYDEAAVRLKKLMEVSPDRWVYQRLADCYEAQGDPKSWRSTLDDFLTDTENTGLDHARVRVQIANALMARGELEEAKEYAEDAAETWAAWAMLCAGEANERLKDWERAELWFRRTSERYPRSSWDAWYTFCRRTGRGDEADARALAEAVVSRVAVSSGSMGFFHWLDDEPSKAVGPFEAAFREAPDATFAASLILLYDKLDDAKQRDEMIETLIDDFGEQAPNAAALCALFRDSLADEGKNPLDLAAVEKVIGSLPPEHRGSSEFIAGEFLLNRDRPEEAATLLKRCAENVNTYIWYRTIAAADLRVIEKAKAP